MPQEQVRLRSEADAVQDGLNLACAAAGKLAGLLASGRFLQLDILHCLPTLLMSSTTQTAKCARTRAGASLMLLAPRWSFSSLDGQTGLSPVNHRSDRDRIHCESLLNGVAPHSSCVRLPRRDEPIQRTIVHAPLAGDERDLRHFGPLSQPAGLSVSFPRPLPAHII